MFEADETQEYLITVKCSHCGEKTDTKVDVQIKYNTAIEVVPQELLWSLIMIKKLNAERILKTLRSLWTMKNPSK